MNTNTRIYTYTLTTTEYNTTQETFKLETQLTAVDSYGSGKTIVCKRPVTASVSTVGGNRGDGVSRRTDGSTTDDRLTRRRGDVEDSIFLSVGGEGQRGVHPSFVPVLLREVLYGYTYLNRTSCPCR